MNNKRLLKYIVASIIIAVILIPMLTTVSMAYVSINVGDTTADYSKDFEIYQNLSEEEKKSAIEPMIFTTTYDSNDAVYISSRQGEEMLLESALDPQYITPNTVVRNQERTNSCWCFAATSALSLKNRQETGEYITYSPAHMEYSASDNSFLDTPTQIHYRRNIGEGGNNVMSTSLFARGMEPVLESSMPFTYGQTGYPQISYADYLAKRTSGVQIQDFTYLPSIRKTRNSNGTVTQTNGYDTTSARYKEYTNEEVAQIRSKFKESIVANGSVLSYMYLPTTTQEAQACDTIKSNYANKYCHYWTDSSKRVNHAILLIGWDDNFAKENFVTTPEHDGAYIALLSNGTSIYNNGYLYISYDDTFVEEACSVINDVDAQSYNNIYQYDELGMSSFQQIIGNSSTTGTVYFNSAYVANVFNRTNTSKQEKLTQVGFWLAEPETIEVYANVSDNQLNQTKLTKIVNGKLYDSGYHVVEIPSDQIITGENFVVCLKLTKTDSMSTVCVPVEVNIEGTSNWDSAVAHAGEGYISADMRSWQDFIGLNNGSICLKAYTEDIETVHPTGITLSKKSNTLKVGSTFQLESTITPTNATNKAVRYLSSNDRIASVSETGLVTATGVGTAVITATTVDGNLSDSCTVVVEEDNAEIPVTSIRLDLSSMSLKIGDTKKLTATVVPEDATDKRIVWSSSDPSKASVSTDGTVTAKAEGKVTIKVTNPASGKYNACIVMVKSQTATEDPDPNPSGNTGNNNNNNGNNGTNTNGNQTNGNGTGTGTNNSSNSNGTSTSSNSSSRGTTSSSSTATTTTQKYGVVDMTTASGKIPQTGGENFIFAGMSTLALAVVMILVIKFKNLRDIK